MTTLSPTTNPYGDQPGGPEPDWNVNQQKIQGAYDTALQNYQSQREGLLQQYGFSSSGGLNDELSNKGTTVAFDPKYQNSIYGNAMKTHGNTLQGLRSRAVMRGIGDYGLGEQDASNYQNQAQAENEGINQNLFSALSGNLAQGRGDLTTYNQDTTDLTTQQGLYKGWGDSNYVSEGGNKPDLSDAEVIGTTLTSGLGNINFTDRLSAGAQLGRIRVSIQDYIEQAGTPGYDSAQLKKFVTDYKLGLKKAGINPNDPKWLLGNAELDKLGGTATGSGKTAAERESDRKDRIKKSQDHLKKDRADAAARRRGKHHTGPPPR